LRHFRGGRRRRRPDRDARGDADNSTPCDAADHSAPEDVVSGRLHQHAAAEATGQRPVLKVEVGRA
jgi:hypothetical protein